MYYRVLYPRGYDKESKKKKFPLVLLLHDRDAAIRNKNHDNVTQLLSSVTKAFSPASVHDSFPAIVVVPQCEIDDPWAAVADTFGADFPEKPEQTYSGELVQRMVKYYLKHYPVDADRVYVVGEGLMGGSGALDLAVRNPKTFAAVVSIGGAVNPDRVKALKKTPVRMYAASESTEVPVSLVRDVYIGLMASGSKVAEPVVEYLGVSDKDCVKNALGSGDFMQWIFSKSR